MSDGHVFVKYVYVCLVVCPYVLHVFVYSSSSCLYLPQFILPYLLFFPLVPNILFSGIPSLVQIIMCKSSSTMTSLLISDRENHRTLLQCCILLLITTCFSLTHQVSLDGLLGVLDSPSLKSGFVHGRNFSFSMFYNCNPVKLFDSTLLLITIINVFTF